LLLLVKISTVFATRDCCFMLLLLAVPPALHAHGKDDPQSDTHGPSRRPHTKPIMVVSACWSW
jgi:hypothetical protein